MRTRSWWSSLILVHTFLIGEKKIFTGGGGSVRAPPRNGHEELFGTSGAKFPRSAGYCTIPTQSDRSILCDAFYPNSSTHTHANNHSIQGQVVGRLREEFLGKEELLLETFEFLHT
jgi:hypothetical protein